MQVKWAMVFEGEPSGDLSVYERVVFVDDHEHALAEKDALHEERIRKLKAYMDEREALIDDQSRELERLQGILDHLFKHDVRGEDGTFTWHDGESFDCLKGMPYHDLLRVAVEFAKFTLTYAENDSKIMAQAVEFLATHATTALQQAKGDE